MPWDKENPPSVSKNWDSDAQAKCISAANAVLKREGWDDADETKKKDIEQSAIFACIHAAGKSKQHAEVSNHYLAKFKQLINDLGYFTKGQIEACVKLLKMDSSLRLNEITPAKIRGLKTSEVLVQHRKLHDSWMDTEDESIKNGLQKVHGFFVSEMGMRRLKHRQVDDLDGGEVKYGEEKEKEASGSNSQEEKIGQGARMPKVIKCAIWTTAYVNDLKDACFLWIQPGGSKDTEGKTKPRSLRHFPYKDASGAVDLPHLRNAIARIPQSNVPGLTDTMKKSLQNKARKMLPAAASGTEIKAHLIRR